MSALSKHVKGPVFLPTIAASVSADFEISTHYGPMKFSELSQKIFAFGKKGMFTYSGPRGVASTIAHGIARRLDAGEEMSKELIERELLPLTPDEERDISFAVVYDTGDDKPMLYRHNMSMCKSKAFGEVYLAGRGSKNLVKLLSELDGPGSRGLSVPAKTEAGAEIYEYFCSALSLTSKLTSLDLSPERKSLKDAHGAAYDIRMLSRAGVTAPKVLYTFSELTMRGTGVSPTLQLKCLMLNWRDGQTYRVERVLTHGVGVSQIPVGGSMSFGIAPLPLPDENVPSDVISNRPWPVAHLPFAVHYVDVFDSAGRGMKCQFPEAMPVGKTSEFITLDFNEANLPVAAKIDSKKLREWIYQTLD